MATKPLRRRRSIKTRVLLLVYGMIGLALSVHFWTVVRHSEIVSSSGTMQTAEQVPLAPPPTTTTTRSDENTVSSVPPPPPAAADPTTLRRHPIPFFFKSSFNNNYDHKNLSICDVPPGVGEEGPAGIRGLYKLRQALLVQQQQQQTTTSAATTTTTTSHAGISSRNKGEQQQQQQQQKVKVFCMIYTHSNRHDVVRSIAATYAPQCDGFLAFSNVTDPAIGAVAVPHIGPERYDNLWNKIRSMWHYIHEQGLVDQYDLFHIGGDDMYVLPTNIRQFATDELWHLIQTQPLYLGASIPHAQHPERRFCGGGAGYTLNAIAVKVLVQQLLVHPQCPPAVASNEDVRIAHCFQIVGIQCRDTNDQQQGQQQGEVRYHHLDVHFHAAYIPSRLALWHWETLQQFHNITSNQKQLAQISTTSISFHLDKGTVRSRERDRGIRRYHAILYGLCGTDFDEQVRRAGTCTAAERLLLRTQWEQTPKVSELHSF
jgi:glycoprotein-N-acetylgalactosamine 3-beta-galactosyltransferase